MTITRAGVALAAAVLIAGARPMAAINVQELPFALRGHTLTLEAYFPAGTPLGTVFMGSGDAGWTGLGKSMAEFLAGRGYVVVGINVKQYLSEFRVGAAHLTVDDPPRDYRAMGTWLRDQRLLHAPVFMSGVSEGAALAVLATADPQNHEWIDGLVTMGVPRTAELAWKWTDFTTWITKKDANEPSFSPFDYVGRVAPVPLVMLQSRTDEYVPAADYERCQANAREPKKLVLIDASNHRFTDRRDELRREYLSALGWVQSIKVH